MENVKKHLITVILVAANCLIFFWMDFTGQPDNAVYMLEHGACYVPLIQEGEVYRLFTSTFLHFNFRHLVNNMLILAVVGSMLEQIIGKWKFLIIYLVSGVAGNLASMGLVLLFHGTPAVSAGASGAVFGIEGAVLYVMIRNRKRMRSSSYLYRFAIMLALSLYIGFTEGGVDNTAHIGGLLAGFLLAAVLYHPGRFRRRDRNGSKPGYGYN